MLAKLIVAETKPVKICGVCGDRAKSYHFGGISCDSCKAFFRRSVQNDAHRAFQCSFQGRCDITMANRKCCQHCRFRKCIDIGMETSWVMTEEERVNMLQARLWKRRPPPPSSSSSSSPTTTNVTVTGVKRERRTRLRSPAADVEDDYDQTCCGQSRDSTRASTADDEDLSSLGDDDSSSPSKRQKILLSSDVSTSRVTDEVPVVDVDPFSVAERMQIDGILKAFHDCFRSRTNLKSAASSCSSKWLLVVLFVVSIQRLVRFARNLEPFSRLHVKDQVALLRSNIFEMFLVVHLCDFDVEVDLAQYRDNHRVNNVANNGTHDAAKEQGATPLKLEVQRKRHCPFLAVGMPGASTLPDSPNENSNESIGAMFRSAIQGDATTLVLLLLVVLFCPDSDELSNPSVVESNQIYFCNLLGRHLQTLSRGRSDPGSPPPQPMSLPKLLLFLPALREMREKHVSFHFDLSDEDVESATSDIVESIEKGFI